MPFNVNEQGELELEQLGVNEERGKEIWDRIFELGVGKELSTTDLIEALKKECDPKEHDYAIMTIGYIKGLFTDSPRVKTLRTVMEMIRDIRKRKEP